VRGLEAVIRADLGPTDRLNPVPPRTTGCGIRRGMLEYSTPDRKDPRVLGLGRVGTGYGAPIRGVRRRTGPPRGRDRRGRCGLAFLIFLGEAGRDAGLATCLRHTKPTGRRGLEPGAWEALISRPCRPNLQGPERGGSSPRPARRHATSAPGSTVGGHRSIRSYRPDIIIRFCARSRPVARPLRSPIAIPVFKSFCALVRTTWVDRGGARNAERGLAAEERAPNSTPPRRPRLASADRSNAGVPENEWADTCRDNHVGPARMGRDHPVAGERGGSRVDPAQTGAWSSSSPSG